MKQIRLLKLVIRNFKGCEFLEINFDGKNKDIFGANEIGKSTIYTALTWLLTGKDEFDRADYEIKNTAKLELNSQAHEVEGIFSVGVAQKKFKRVFNEKWTKPRGQATKVFDGHFTDFWFNDVPCKLKEFQEEVNEMIPANLLKLLTNPHYFNNLPWENQRSGLLAISGGITDEEVIQSIVDPEHDYAELIKVLQSGKTLEKYADELNAKKLLLKKKAIELPPRIDEAEHNKPKPDDWDAIQKEINKLNGDVEGIDVQLNDAAKQLQQKQTNLLSLQKKLGNKRVELNDVRMKVKTKYNTDHADDGKEKTDLETKIKNLNSSILLLKKQISDSKTTKEAKEQRIQEKEARIAQLREDWNLINAEQFHFDEAGCVCPTCNRALEPGDVETQKEDMRTNFNNDVLRRKSEKVNDSNVLKMEVKQLQEDNTATDQWLETNENELNIRTLELETATNALNVINDAQEGKVVVDVEKAVDHLMKNNADALNIQDEIKQLEQDIEKEQKLINDETGNTANDQLKEQKKSIGVELDALKKRLALKDTIENTDKRIEQLKNEESANAQEIANLEKQEFEIESFTRAKMNILEKKVNSKFQYVSFRLFKKQVNGGIAETCVCEYKDVPYPTLNTAAKLLAGLDILNTLSEYYQISAFAFCDNRESSTFIPKTNSQIISLFVSPQDTKLRIEDSK